MAFKTYNALLNRIIELETEVAELRLKSIPVSQSFNFTEPTTTVTLTHNVNTNSAIWVTYETLPQKLGIDFTITDNTLQWINPTDTELLGHFDIIYYRA